MMKLCLRIAGTGLLSADITGDADDIGIAYRPGFAHVTHRMNLPPLIPTWLPTPRNLPFSRVKKLLDRVVMGLLPACRKDSVAKDDLLSVLLVRHDSETGAGKADQCYSSFIRAPSAEEIQKNDAEFCPNGRVALLG
jgi:hypothetical protein